MLKDKVEFILYIQHCCYYKLDSPVVLLIPLPVPCYAFHPESCFIFQIHDTLLAAQQVRNIYKYKKL